MRRAPVFALLALLALTSYDFSTRPQRLVESFRAMRCCAEHCQSPRNMSAAERCCGVAADDAETRAVSAVSDLGSAALAVLPLRVETGSVQLAQSVITRSAEPSRGPPIYLRQLSLIL